MMMQQQQQELMHSQDQINPDNMSYEELSALGEVIGTVNKGLSPEILNRIPCGKVGLGEFRGIRDEECSVCRMEYESRQEIMKLPCGHYYHGQCIRKWLENNKVCPICLKEIGVEQMQGKRGHACSSRAT
eukprot:TRINITY_DN3011_c0_g2_i5.p2 TRINITY_DN3011_c0_g2~~TRINITY_DN3011_c0_g2_i5.p2  ORF type:complete len:130 (+),score=16.39 TRINITY_DN3011_c0_g2_i5:107-496(+)